MFQTLIGTVKRLRGQDYDVVDALAFQTLIGTVKSISLDLEINDDAEEFQTLIGTVKRASAKGDLVSATMFQTLIGTVKREYALRILDKLDEVSNPHRYGQKAGVPTRGTTVGVGFKPS